MKDSGDTIRQNEITPRGNQRIRRMLIESAWSAVRYDASMAAGFGTYCRRMKKNRAIVRIARILSYRQPLTPLGELMTTPISVDQGV